MAGSLIRCCQAAGRAALVRAVAAPSSAQVFAYITDSLDRTVSVPVGYCPQAFGNFFTKSPIFADGFESGGTSKWSACVS